MIAKHKENPVYLLYDKLFEILKFNIENDNKEYNYREIDRLTKNILLNNGCRIPSDNSEQYIVSTDTIIPNEYVVYFIKGMIGNNANEYYDFLISNGMKVLVIFLDYFDIVKNDSINNNDPLYELKINMGNSVYYDAIKRIVEVFYLTSEPIPSGLLTTAMATNQRWNQAIIAIHILNYFKPVDENDVSDIAMEDVKKILNTDIKLQLYGIRTM